jgi:diguanylate cyclase (GGDEF)-like protein
MDAVLRRVRALCAICAAVLAGAADARAQYRFDHFTTSNGLPQSTISSIVQTRDGYLWFGTYDGLVRYDGVRFTIFDKGNTPAIHSNQIVALCEDVHGTLWAGTTEGGLIRYRDGAFASFTTAEGLPDNFVSRIENTPQGLILTMRGVPHRWAGDRATPLDPAVLSDFVDRRGARWTRRSDRLIRSAGGADTAFDVPLTLEEFRNRYEDPGGALWFATQSRGVYRIAGGGLAHYDATNGLPPGDWVRAAGTDATGSLWLFNQKALVTYKDDRFTIYDSYPTLESNNVRVTFVDREGTVWIGTNENGLFRARRRFLVSYAEADGLHGRSVYPIFEDREGTIWIGSGNGLTRYAGGTFVRHVIVREANGGLSLRAPGGAGPFAGVRAFTQDRDGRVWLGLNGGLATMEQGRLVDRTALVNGGTVDAIVQDRAGRMWIAAGRSVVRVDGGDVTAFPDQEFLPGSPNALFEDRQGRIWIGTRGGIARFESGRFVSIRSKDGLAGDRVRAFYEDAAGVMWVGTFDSGISRIENGRITNFSTDTGLFNNGAFQILEDARGYFWISCNRGIYRVKREQMNDVARGAATVVNSVAYGSQDGMLSSEANGGRQPAGVEARDGRLWFPTQNGVVTIDPAAESYATAPPPIVIETVLVDGVPVPFAGGVRVEPGQRDVEINYTAPSSIKAEHIHFKYKLDGLTPRWVDAGTRRSVHYSHLPAGAYTFTLMAANSDGVWNERGVTLAVRILPHFYQTRWFGGLVLLVLGAGAAGAVALRLRHLKARERRLMQLVADRTSELQSAHDRLQQLATTDGLTNIANHRRFKEFLGQEWQRAQRTRAAVSMLLLDVDHFKLYNDTYGHQAGDECLKRVAVAITETVQRGTDLAARYGGEEFAVVLTDTGTQGAAVVAETIRARVEAMQIPHSASNTHRFVTISVGVATRVGIPDVGPDGLITAADSALYNAKRMGRNRCVTEAEEAYR